MRVPKAAIRCVRSIGVRRGAVQLWLGVDSLPDLRVRQRLAPQVRVDAVRDVQRHGAWVDADLPEDSVGLFSPQF